jgi:uracil-DNA glycosylase
MIKTWKELFQQEKSKTYYQVMMKTLEDDKEEIVGGFPGNVMQPFKQTPLDRVKVVIPAVCPALSGADGLAWSNEKMTPSLQNIFIEVMLDCYKEQADRPIEEIFSPDLSSWASQGVFLMNLSPTVRNDGSDDQEIWRPFMQEVMETLYAQQRHIIWLLWGDEVINFCNSDTGGYWGNVQQNPQHKVLRSPGTPHPRLADKYWHGNGHFSHVNAHLYMCREEPIVWMNKQEEVVNAS